MELRATTPASPRPKAAGLRLSRSPVDDRRLAADNSCGSRVPTSLGLTDHVLALHRRLVGVCVSGLIPISARRTAMVSAPDGLTERARMPRVLKIGSCNGL